MAKRTSAYSTAVKLNVETMSVDVTIKERESDEIVDTGSFPASEIHDDLKSHVALYGYSKLLQDRTSDTPTGPDKLAAMKDTAAQFAAGQWQKERKVGAPTVSAEVEALAQLKSISIPQAQAALRRYDKAQREKILSNDQIVALAKEIRAAREAEEVVNLDELAA